MTQAPEHRLQEGARVEHIQTGLRGIVVNDSDFGRSVRVSFLKKGFNEDLPFSVDLSPVLLRPVNDDEAPEVKAEGNVVLFNKGSA